MFASRLVLVLLALPNAAWPQPPADSLVPGRLVRITTPTRRQAGTLAGISPDSLAIRPPYGGRAVYPVATILKLEVGRRGRATTTGLLVGAGLGALSATWFLSRFCRDTDDRCDGRTYLKAGFLIGLPPAAAGAGVGALIPRVKWERIRLPFQLEVGPSPGGLAIRLGMTH